MRSLSAELASGIGGILYCILPGYLAAQADRSVRHGTGSPVSKRILRAAFVAALFSLDKKRLKFPGLFAIMPLPTQDSYIGNTTASQARVSLD